MILLISFLITVGISIFFGYRDGKKRELKELAFYKWQNQVLTQLEKISNKF